MPKRSSIVTLLVFALDLDLDQERYSGLEK